MQRSTTAPFVDRFSRVRAAASWTRIAAAVSWGAFIAGCGVALLTAADYQWELAWSIRAAGLAVATGVALAVAVVGVFRSLFQLSEPQTARQIEARLPQLGQRVRTVVQFAGRDAEAVSQEGVKPTLVAALEEETDRQAQGLDLNVIVPRRQAMGTAALAAAPVVLILGALLMGWQWRLAVRRALLADQPYTMVVAEPGDVTIDQGSDLALTLTLRGRVDRPVTLLTRTADTSTGWHAQSLGPESLRERSKDGRRAEYTVALRSVAEPLDYRFLAGSSQSRAYHVAIRYPLTIKKFEATLTPPRYTGLPPKTVKGGNLDVIEGSQVRFRLQFDRPCREAYLVVREPPYKSPDADRAPPPVRVPLKPTSAGLVATLNPRDDKLYWIVAAAKDGGSLLEKRYRIRVLKDQPPHVHFESPPEAWEVNLLAEVPMRIRVEDDFGVSKAGIVFQIDNGDEQQLVTRQFSTAVKPAGKGNFELTTRAALDALLCLEDFPVTETSAVTYYAYVEDNHPGKPQRTETDLRFIEIRPFQRLFVVGGT